MDEFDISNDLSSAYNALSDFAHTLWKAHDNAIEPPTTLFHYTSAEAAFNILNNSEIWATEVLSMNDPTEGLHAGRLIRRLLNEWKGSIPESLMEGFEDDSVAEALDSRLYVACFCSKGDLLIQWRGYGLDGRGYALGFSRERLRNVANLTRVSYDQKDIVSFLKATIEHAVQQITTTPMVREDFEKYWQTVARFINQSLVRFKDPAFQEEQEWRLMVVNRPTFMGKFRTAGSKIVPYASIKIPIEGISTIRLGASVWDEREAGFEEPTQIVRCWIRSG